MIKLTHFDAIIVGAGFAGSSAALHMASNGMRTALLERGKFPGSKNMFGGVIYVKPTSAEQLNLWGRETISLPREKIEDCFHTDATSV